MNPTVAARSAVFTLWGTIALGQRECDDAAARRRAVLAAAAGDDHVLAAVDAVYGRRRVACGRQQGLPEQLAGGGVVGAEHVVEVRGPDEQEAARGDDGAAVVVAAGVGEPLLDELCFGTGLRYRATATGYEIFEAR